MKNLWTIVKKELARFFKDRRLMCSLILPGVLIYFVYSLMGGGLMDGLTSTEQTYEIYTLNAPAGLETELGLSSDSFSVTEIAESEAEEIKEKIQAQEADLFLAFPSGFSFDGSTPTAAVDVYYNTASDSSSAAFSVVSALISAKQFDSPNFLTVSFDLVTEKDMTGMIFSMIAPMLVLTLLFAGCVAIAPESIAGEKERGTFATMLVTPVKRSSIAFGKIIALSVLALMSGFCSFLGLMLSLPKLMGEAVDGVSMSVYGVGDYAMLLGVILSTVLVIVALISVVSALAKSVKEAAGMVTPLMIVAVLAGVSTMFSEGGGPVGCFIPLYNSAISMSGIFSFAANPAYVLIGIGVNVVAAVLLALLLAKMFDSERVMFDR